jgi:mRNA interferase MazF
MKRGDVYRADLVPRSGSEQMGRRPLIVLSHDGFNQTPAWRSIIVVPITASPRARRASPTVIPLPGKTPGLSKPSAALCHQITTLDRAKLTERLGALPPEILEQVEEAVKAALDL